MDIGLSSTGIELGTTTTIGSTVVSAAAAIAGEDLLIDNSSSYFFAPNSYTYYGETFVVFCFLLLGLILNAPLLYVYFVSNQARSIADKFLINLILADILSLLILLPTIIVDLLLLERNEEIYFRNMTHLMATQVLEVSTHFIQNNTLHHHYNTISLSNSSSAIIDINTTTILYNNSNNNNSYTTSINSNSNNNNNNSYLSIINSNNSNSSNKTFLRRFIGLNEEEEDIEYVHKLLDPDDTLNAWCTFKKCLVSGIATASILSTLEIAMERYLAIVTPLHYHKFLTKYKVLMTSFGGGFIAIGSAVLSSFDPCEPVFPSCTRTTISYTSTYWWPLYTLGHVTLFFILPVLCMAGIYIRIWLEARRQKAKISSQYKKPFFLEVTSSSAADEKIKDHGPKFFLHPVILRFKIIDRFVTARMDRAARVAICTLMVTILCWTPYYYVQCAHSIRSILEQMKGQMLVKESWSHVESTVPILAASLHPVLAPLFYGYRYTVIRDRVLILFSLDKWFPTIRERRSNSLSRHFRSPSCFKNSGALESIKRKKQVSFQQSQLASRKELQTIDHNNHQQGLPTSPIEVKESAETQSEKAKDKYTIIQIEANVSNVCTKCEYTTPNTPLPPRSLHTYLFTIGALDDEEENESNISYDPRQIHNEFHHQQQQHITISTSPVVESESSSSSSSSTNTNYCYFDSNQTSNCSSSDSLLLHCCANNYCTNNTNEIQRTTTTTTTTTEAAMSSKTSTSTKFSSPKFESLKSKSNSTTFPSSSSSSPATRMIVFSWEVWSHLIQNFVHWMEERWNTQRQSVSSTSSVVTLLSSRSISSDSLPM